MKEHQKPIRTDPALWEACKQEAVELMGKFSARAMQRAVVLYKKRGGGYVGHRSSDNALVKWNTHERAREGRLGMRARKKTAGDDEL